jgi:hypothetical protein
MDSNPVGFDEKPLCHKVGRITCGTNQPQSFDANNKNNCPSNVVMLGLDGGEERWL